MVARRNGLGKGLDSLIPDKSVQRARKKEKEDNAAEKAEAATKAEEAEKAEAARKAEETEKAEAAEKKEAARKAEQAERAEATRKAEAAEKAEAARKAEEAEKAEAARKAETDENIAGSPEPIVGSGEQMVKITSVEPNRGQPRKDFDEDSLLELADSIKQFGVLQPLLVSKKNDYYEIIAGERRWRAAKLAGIKEVPILVKDYTDQEIVEISLIENIQRENLNPIEEAMAYKKLLEEFSLKQDEVAERVSKSRTAVTNSMRLLKLENRIQQMIVDDMISTGHARALLAIDDDEQRFILANKIFDEKLSVRETEKLIKSIKNPKKEVKKVPVKDKFIYDNLEERMKNIIGTKVNVTQKTKGKGRIEIEYYSEDELERIFDLIMSIKDN